jgi:hypothetical protein
MKKFYKLSEIGKISCREMVIFILIFLTGPVLLILDSIIFKSLVFAVLSGGVICLIFNALNKKKMRKNPYNYLLLLILLLLSFIDIFLIYIINNPIIFSYGLIFPLFSYLYISGILVFYSVDVFFIFCLKRIFPYEGELQKNQANEIGLKKLSKFIDLDMQKLYLSLSLINIILYLLLVIFLMLLVIKHVNGGEFGMIEVLSIWVQKQDYITLFNALSLLSLLIAIYTITIPAQGRIIKDAKRKFLDKYREQT